MKERVARIEIRSNKKTDLCTCVLLAGRGNRTRSGFRGIPWTNQLTKLSQRTHFDTIIPFSTLPSIKKTMLDGSFSRKNRISRPGKGKKENHSTTKLTRMRAVKTINQIKEDEGNVARLGLSPPPRNTTRGQWPQVHCFVYKKSLSLSHVTHSLLLKKNENPTERKK